MGVCMCVCSLLHTHTHILSPVAEFLLFPLKHLVLAAGRDWNSHTRLDPVFLQARSCGQSEGCAFDSHEEASDTCSLADSVSEAQGNLAVGR